MNDQAATAPQVHYAGVNHLALVTNDMDATVRFYRDVLGMELVATTGNDPDGPPYRHYFFSLGPGSTIAFFEWPDVELPPRKDSGIPASGRHFDHVSIGLTADDEIDRLRQRIERHGYEVSDPVDHGLVRSIYLEDPNGISLEFSVWGQDLDAEPFFEDRDPVPAVVEAESQTP